MGKPYKSNKSFICDMIISYSTLYKDFPQNDDVFYSFNEDISKILYNIISNKDDLNYFDYELICIDDDNNNVSILPMNLMSALWFNGIFPYNGGLVEKQGKFEYKDKKYTFNEDKLLLVIEKIKKEKNVVKK